jgi:prolipoprotein diacylglyceryltransferase
MKLAAAIILATIIGGCILGTAAHRVANHINGALQGAMQKQGA